MTESAEKSQVISIIHYWWRGNFSEPLHTNHMLEETSREKRLLPVRRLHFCC